MGPEVIWLWIVTLIVALVSGAVRNVYDVAESMPAPAPTPAPVYEPPVVEAFVSGYRDGGGDPAWEEHWIDDVIPCESPEWVLDPPGIHYGLAQFEEGTWIDARCSVGADYRSAWEQGCAVASWMQQIPGRWGTTAGWPTCWWR